MKYADFLLRFRKLNNLVQGLRMFSGEEVESSNHVLMLCTNVQNFLSNFLRWFGTDWVVPCSVRMLLIWWHSWRFRKAKKAFGKAFGRLLPLPDSNPFG